MLISLANSLETTESSSSSSSSSQVHDHDDEPILELYMHDILGGNNNDNNPTARPVTGLLGAIYGGRVPFSKPIAARPSNGVVVVTASQLAGIAIFLLPVNTHHSLGFPARTEVGIAISDPSRSYALLAEST